MTVLTELAPAKVNLSLHVGPVKANGRHDLVSLVSFAGLQASDTLIAEPAERFSLVVNGPFAGDAGETDHNLVLAAARAMATAYPGKLSPLAFKLTKSLPCAAGLGGGSADAGAALRLICRAEGGEAIKETAQNVAPKLGGDVLACLHSIDGMMRGEGEIYTPTSHVPRLPTLLVNPGVACPTGTVFQHYDTFGAQMPAHPNLCDTALPASDFVARLQTQTVNSLEAPDISLVPEIGDTLASLRQLPSVQLARMSGSGATCFAIFETMEAVTKGANWIKHHRPNWWFAATWLGG